MVEPIMYIGIGFIVAGLLVIGVIPLVHGRAVRLTMRRLEALNPLSMAEIQADKDQLRAEFAMSTRRLELSLEQMKAKATTQLADIGKKTEAISRLKFELGEKTAALLALEAREKQLNDDLQSLQAELAARSSALEEAGQALTGVHGELVQVSGHLNDRALTADSQRVELAALHAQVEMLKNQIDGYQQEARSLREKLDGRTAEAEGLNQQLAEERGKTEHLDNRLAELDRQLVVQTTESEVLGRRAQELTARLDEQSRFLADREFVTDRLRNDALTAQKTESEVRAELADIEKRHRIENAALRERITDVAAEVAHLTAALEGPGSAIDAIVNADVGRAGAVPNGTNGTPSIAPGAGAEPAKRTLADRIRALQGRAARVTHAGRA